MRKNLIRAHIFLQNVVRIDYIFISINTLKSTVVLQIETSQLICTRNQKTDFYIYDM